MTTTIKGSAGGELLIGEDHEGHRWITFGRADIFPMAGILAALDAVPKRSLRMVQDELLTSREHYMGELAAVSANRDQNAKMLREALAERDEWKARAEECEAAVDRVREVLGEDGPPSYEATFNAISNIIDPHSAFTLPNKPGTRFTAVDNLGKRSEFEAVVDGPDVMFLNRRTFVIWSRANVLDYCTDHRYEES